MENKIYILTDYKGYFGSNYDSIPYRSGFDKDILVQLFLRNDYEVVYLYMSEVQSYSLNWNNKLVLYTSNEEDGLYYKSYIEDVILYLKEAGAILLPEFRWLRANNNKSFMELLKRNICSEDDYLPSRSFGCIEDLYRVLKEIQYPVVFKPAEGSMSRGVQLIKSQKHLMRIVKKSSRTSSVYMFFKDILRKKKHDGYQMNSRFEKRFILQPYISNLKNDWKVLVFGKRVFILNRGIRPDDFRASGSHYNYSAGSEAGFPIAYLDYIVEFAQKANLPNISIDFVYDGVKGYIIEFQGLYFGLSTHNYSKDYYFKENGQWVVKKNNLSKEELFVDSIVDYLKNKF